MSVTEILRPTGAGDKTELGVQFPASDFHWDKVDEAVSDNDTTYLEPNTGTYADDLFTFPALSFPSDRAVISVSFGYTIRQVGSLTRSGWFARLVRKVGGIEAVVTEFRIESLTYHSSSRNAWAGYPWTINEINASQFGIGFKILSGYYHRITQLYMIVIVEDAPVIDYPKVQIL